MFISHVIFWNYRIKNTLNKKKSQNIYTMNAEKDVRIWMQYYCQDAINVQKRTNWLGFEINYFLS